MNTPRQAAIIEALSVFDSGLTVMELSYLLDRTGGDITKGVSGLRQHGKIATEYFIQDQHNRKTARYRLTV
jgi:hypothetical protein